MYLFNFLFQRCIIIVKIAALDDIPTFFFVILNTAFYVINAYIPNFLPIF